MYFKRIRLAKCLKSCKSWRRILFFVTMVVGMNFNPFHSNLISGSVKSFLDRFFMNFLLSSRREEVGLICFFLRSFLFLRSLPLFRLSPSALVLEHSVNGHVYSSTFLYSTKSCRVLLIELTLSTFFSLFMVYLWICSESLLHFCR